MDGARALSERRVLPGYGGAAGHVQLTTYHPGKRIKLCLKRFIVYSRWFLDRLLNNNNDNNIHIGNAPNRNKSTGA